MMTPAEAAVWGTTFATVYDKAIRNPPSHILKGTNEARREWEKGMASEAVEWAAGAVRELRGIRERVERGHGEGEVLSILDEALGTGQSTEED